MYEIFKNKLGEKEAGIIIEYFGAKTAAKYQEKKEALSTKEDLSQVKVDLIKWMVGFWIVQMAAIIGLYLHN